MSRLLNAFLDPTACLMLVAASTTTRQPCASSDVYVVSATYAPRYYALLGAKALLQAKQAADRSQVQHRVVASLIPIRKPSLIK